MIVKYFVFAVTILFCFHSAELERNYGSRSRRPTRGRENVDGMLGKFSDLIEEGTSSVEYISGDVILVLGNIGSGKTTLTQFLVEDNSELTSVRNRRGEFTIKDNDNRISSNPAEPRTIFPEIYLDNEGNQVFYDCPGFDPADPILEISEAYFMDQIWNYADRLKFILTLDSTDLGLASLQNNIQILLESAINYLNNIDKYRGSFALIITKVNNVYKRINGVDILTADDDIIEVVAEALKNLKNSIINNSDALKLVDTLLQEDNGKYDRIGIFRRPDRTGTLDNIDLLQSSKHKLYSLIENLNYTESYEDDFSYEPSEKAYDIILKLHTKSKMNVNLNMTNIFNEIERFHDKNLEETRNVLDMLRHDIILSMNNLKSCVDFDHFDLNNILDCVSHFEPNVYSLSNNFLNTALSVGHKKILEKVARGNIDNDDTIEINFLTKMELSLTENIVDYVAWESIYSSLLAEMDTYDKHVNSSAPTELISSVKDNKELINVLKESYNISQNLVLSKALDIPKISVLGRIQQETTREVIYECQSPGILTVKGTYIVTSKIDIKNKCQEPVILVEIFAMRKIFLDALPSDIQDIDVAIISPNLEQINFSLIQYGSSHRSKNFWTLSYMNLFGIRNDFYLHVKPCMGHLTRCYTHAFAPSINRYKRFVLANSIIQRNEDMKFFKTLNKKSWAFLKVYDTFGFIDEFINLEEEIQRSENKMDFLPVYTTLLDRIKDYSHHPDPDEQVVGYKKALKYLYTATLSKICNIKNGLDNNLIIDIHEYLKLVIEDVREFREESKKEALHYLIIKYKNKYNEEINSRIDEGNDFIENYLSKEIEQLIKEANDKIPQLLEELLSFKNSIREDIAYSERKYVELQGIMAKKAILGAISIASKILYIFGFWGAIASAIVDATASAVNELTPNDINFDRRLTELPPGVQNLLDRTKLSLQKVEDLCIEALEDKLYVVLHYLQENPNSFPSSSAKFRAIKFELRRIKYSKGSIQRIDQLAAEFDQEMRNLEQAAVRFRRRLEQSLIVGNIKAGLEVVKMGRHLFDETKSDSEKLHRIKEIIQESKDKVVDLNKYEEKVFQLVKPTLNNLQSYVDDLKKDASVQSEIGLIVSKWEMKDILKDVKLELQGFTRGFGVESDLARCIEKLYEAVNTVLSIYQRIEQYRDNKQLADFVADIALASNDDLNNDNSEIGKSVNNLDKIIKTNVIINQYDRVIDAFKQYAFPFADFFMRDFTLPKSLVTNNTNGTVEEILKHLEDLEKRLSISLVTIDPNIDKYLHEFSFNSNYTTSKPFYVWKNNQHKNVIAKLLAGEEIVLKADIMKNGHNKNAVKFNLIGLNIKAIKKSLQDELDEALKQFGVVMTHMGNSYYRCDDKYYVIESQAQEISYSFEKKRNGEPLETNIVYNKIAGGDRMLSPYTLWKIKLAKHSEVSFDLLKKFVNRVNLELVGHGYYVDMDSEVCKMNLETYYNLANPVYDMVNLLPPAY